MKTNPSTEAKADVTLLGQLIAELSKFGGMDKAKASQLARILLPHIEAYTAQKCKEARIDELERCVEQTEMERHNNGFAVPYGFIQDRIAELNGSGGEDE